MNVLEAIRARHSTRAFVYQPIPRDVLVQLVDCGRWAPSGRNEQPIEYVVVDDRERIREIALLTDNGRFAVDAGALVVVVSRDVKYALEDGAAAVQNVLLAATALGYASCWIAGDKKDYAGRLLTHLEVREGWRLIAILAIGTEAPDALKKVRERRPIDEILHWNGYRAR
jgi:nitroreductase